tara:strand:+ start:2738 stop:3301 length:564 start_codon:yes stop_codon:yes gene_type:complete
MSKIYGTVDKVYYQHNDRVEDLNERLFDRNTCVRPVTAMLNVRSTPTKYVTMPITNMRPTSTVQCPHVLPYDIEKQFFPGNTKSPWEGYKVDQETILRNHQFALQKCEQNVYVPSSNSDLYAKTVPSHLYTGRHQNMFDKPDLNPKNTNPESLGLSLFYNHTREQRIDYGDMQQNIHSDRIPFSNKK